MCFVVETVSKATTCPSQIKSSATPSSSKSALQKLTDMGFALSAAQHALGVCGEYVEKAVSLLTTGDTGSPILEHRGLEETNK